MDKVTPYPDEINGSLGVTEMKGLKILKVTIPDNRNQVPSIALRSYRMIVKVDGRN
jgi:hypothetical protein